MTKIALLMFLSNVFSSIENARFKTSVMEFKLHYLRAKIFLT